ncbi:hypothetical protein HNQ50_002467 [Silvimonas terrae]|uniref:Uncharacterized protein n=1 Tax=Silvimonas terrae TaxID=300266 RepID=A0A840RFD5_9NEIS|nr:hypothetical protein [Silvimonas terrae]MBB5191737.1 hypothetical protein [Silvimonas terrae]
MTRLEQKTTPIALREETLGVIMATTITVYRIRFWDINTCQHVLSEGFLTKEAAEAEHLEIEPRSGIDVERSAVLHGRYPPSRAVQQTF